MAHVTAKVLFSLMRGLMFPILIKGITSIKNSLCRGNNRYTGHTHLMSWLYYNVSQRLKNNVFNFSDSFIHTDQNKIGLKYAFYSKIP